MHKHTGRLKDKAQTMQTHQLEDLTLLLIRDADEPEMWLDRWAVSYPMVRVAEAART